MTVRTKYMTHFNSAADGFINLEALASGLASELFEGLKALAIEKGSENLVAEFDKAMSDVENARKLELVKLTGEQDMTLTKFSKSFKQRKYELNKGLKAGLDPTKFETFSKYRKGSDKATGSNTTGSNGGSGKVNGKETGGSGAPSKLNVVPSGLDPAVQKKLNILMGSLTKLSTEGQKKYLDDSIGALNKLAQAGGRYSNVNSKTA